MTTHLNIHGRSGTQTSTGDRCAAQDAADRSTLGIESLSILHQASILMGVLFTRECFSTRMRLRHFKVGLGSLWPRVLLGNHHPP